MKTGSCQKCRREGRGKIQTVETKRTGRGQDLEIHYKCPKCGSQGYLCPNLLNDIFSI